MEPAFLLLPVILSFFILAVPARMQFLYTTALTLFTIVVTSIPAVKALAGPGETLTIVAGNAAGTITFTIDSLSAYFILIVNFTVLTGLLYSNGYLRPYRREMPPARFALHYFSYCWLYLSMLAVLMLREGVAFLIAWELMAVSSFMLILFEAENRVTLKTAVSYLVQMHIGMALLVIAFLLVEAHSGQFGFDGMERYFASRSNLPLFFLFFAGFAIKAGFLPFHTWLPEAHPAAPSHVSGVMSGVMIKMGIFGIVRLLLAARPDAYPAGLALLAISMFTALYGILMSSLQTDLKRILAFSSIENIGIIGIGLGVGAIGIGTQNHLLAVAGFGGGLFHVLNHSLFKSLLFFSAGSVYQATHSRDVNLLGGLIHRMPRTAGLFLLGSMAICALPPLNGFISEMVIYYALFKGMQAGTMIQAMIMMLSVAALAVAGGLAIFGFSRAFGLSFLGTPRSEISFREDAVTPGMIFPKLLIAVMILVIGLAPALFLNPLLDLVAQQLHTGTAVAGLPLVDACSKISVAGLLLILMVAGLLIIRRMVVRPGKVAFGPTWGCGYTAATPRQQYTSSSWADNVAVLADPVISRKVDYDDIHPEELFPSERSFAIRTKDFFGTLTGITADYAMLALKKMARLQTGHIQHYLLYAFVFMLILFVLLWLNLI